MLKPRVPVSGRHVQIDSHTRELETTSTHLVKVKTETTDTSVWTSELNKIVYLLFSSVFKTKKNIFGNFYTPKNRFFIQQK